LKAISILIGIGAGFITSGKAGKTGLSDFVENSTNPMIVSSRMERGKEPRGFEAAKPTSPRGADFSVYAPCGQAC